MLTDDVAIFEQTRHANADVRRDGDMLADVWTRLWHDGFVRTLERSALAIEAHDGEVVLLGHVSSAAHRGHIAELVRAMPGVTAVRDELVADSELAAEVAQALATDARTGPYLIQVSAFLGWIRLRGQVPDQETRTVAETTAAGVARVRGVLVLPHVRGLQAHPASSRRPLQPRLIDPVYARDSLVGCVAQVVVNPHNRLVSHIVVAADRMAEWSPTRGGRLVPVEVVERADSGGVSLAGGPAAFAARPVFVESDFPLAPLDWRPPFPYAPGSVRWLAGSPDPQGAPAVMAWDDDGGAPA